MSADPLPRSPELMARDDTGLLVVDVQEKLMPLIPGQRRLIWNIGRLVRGAQAVGLPVAGTEQYPKGLGPTVPELAALLGPLPDKLAFSCGACGEVFARFRERNVVKLLLAGIEAHVCVQQTVFDLLAAGFRVYVAVDAVASRFEIDREVALRRMDSAGATLTTVEAALFEWCGASGTPEFKTISALVREQPPSP
jgi:nicotinamidase-related amidase